MAFLEQNEPTQKKALGNSLAAETNALSDSRSEETRRLQAFFEAADGIRTHDLLHGKQTL
jgi:hypothetical protein